MVGKGFYLFICGDIFILVCTLWKKQRNICGIKMMPVYSCGRWCDWEQSGNSVELVNIMGCLLNFFIVVGEWYSRSLPPPLTSLVSSINRMCLCVYVVDHKCLLPMYSFFLKIDRNYNSKFFFVALLFIDTHNIPSLKHALLHKLPTFH